MHNKKSKTEKKSLEITGGCVCEGEGDEKLDALIAPFRQQRQNQSISYTSMLQEMEEHNVDWQGATSISRLLEQWVDDIEGNITALCSEDDYDSKVDDVFPNG